ncbi:MAG: hypothetical protein IPH26_08770 [Sterolibacteriaceae bacterium]|uniref:Secreted protein n=1 Tax=Candidatus Methylophosphatis roskildensis TaxID=2899263 RepID=A0A9D7E523_9PROT|nr:hypothetical protein [Candidatus Methylophosphatis roskildensis]MBK7237571.1 hypothetical protein [Sterolibacteriaceae bacterium]
MRAAVVSLYCAFALTGASVGWAANSLPPSLCLRDERTVFSCPLENDSRVVSLCGSRDLGEGAGYLQYRFGRSGNVELEFPRQRPDSWKAFRYSRYSRFQVDRFSVSFSIRDHTYTLFDNYEGEMEPATHEAGITITRSGKTVGEWLCRCPGSGNLRALQSIVPCDKDDVLNMGGCG